MLVTYLSLALGSSNRLKEEKVFIKIYRLVYIYILSTSCHYQGVLRFRVKWWRNFFIVFVIFQNEICSVAGDLNQWNRLIIKIVHLCLIQFHLHPKVSWDKSKQNWWTSVMGPGTKLRSWCHDPVRWMNHLCAGKEYTTNNRMRQVFVLKNIHLKHSPSSFEHLSHLFLWMKHSHDDS